MASAKIRILDYKNNKDNTHPVVLQVIVGRKRRLITLGRSTKEQWNYENDIPNNKHPDKRSLTDLLMNKSYKARKLINAFEEENRPFTVDTIAKEISPCHNTSSVFGYFNEFISRLQKASKHGNSKVYINTRNVFKHFRNEKDIEFRELDFTVIRSFQDYLEKKGNSPNTVSVHLRTLRALYNSAINENIVPETLYPFRKLKIRNEKTVKRAIDKEYIRKIRNLKLTDGSETEKARDYFLFSFNMRGMSFVDIAFLKIDNISGDRVEYKRQKTGQRFSIKLTNEARDLITKYCGCQTPGKYIFPIIKRKGSEFLDYRNAMRLTNKKLKDVGKMVDCPIPLTTYVSRHSWATIAKKSGYNTNIISEGLGHDSEETTQIYLDSFDHELIDNANDDITE